ncbi:pyridoxal phosphate-dependent transferase [Gorgonomyces haynaldii]|nr:pyridoxal phosphate-dependent transferase [Gorgonomyces haynaldii]
MTIQDYSPYLTQIAKNRKPSAIRQLQKLSFTPGMISLGGGLPHPSTFPFESVSFKTRDGKEFQVSQEDLIKGLQYGPTQGDAHLLEWVEKLQKMMHSPQVPVDICLGNGSQDLLAKAFDMLVDTGDALLIESPAYVGILAFLRPKQLQFLTVDLDEHGLVPDSMRKVLQSAQKKPKVLYTVPVGGNPTGVSTTFERKKEIYKICQEHDILIMEDDPYYYLQFGDRIPSYLSLDTDGRVLRFDSFSKVLSAGARIGWVTGPAPLVHLIILDGMSSNLHPSGISQVLLYTLLNQIGQQGFLEHTLAVTAYYKQRRDVFCAALTKHLSGIAQWDVPDAGMFVWIKLLGVKDSFQLISTKAVEKKVLLVPGSEFYPGHDQTGYVRAAFSLASDEQIDLALQRLRELIIENREQ